MQVLPRRLQGGRRLKKALYIIVFIAVAFWFLTRPQSLGQLETADWKPDLANGESLFHAGGCASCHGDDLGGGAEEFLQAGLFQGTFRVPNISSDPQTGIGAWSDLDFVNAMKFGVAPNGSHYYPAFPYTSYARMTLRDLLDLKAYLDQLPAVEREVGDHDIAYPWNLRRGIGLWKQLYLDPAPVRSFQNASGEVLRGQYLVEGAGHCGECHTPRTFLGGLDLDRWLAGADSAGEEGEVPDVTASAEGIGEWSRSDLEFYFESGLTPEFDAVGGTMVKVQENLSRLSEADRKAIAAYLLN